MLLPESFAAANLHLLMSFGQSGVTSDFGADACQSKVNFDVASSTAFGTAGGSGAKSWGSPSARAAGAGGASGGFAFVTYTGN